MLSIFALLVAAKADTFIQECGGIWTDSSGNFVAVNRDGICFLKDDKYFVGSKIEKNAEGNYYFGWIGSKAVLASSVPVNSKRGQIPDDYFLIKKADNHQLEGEGLIKLGLPNSRGSILNFDMNCRRFEGGTLSHSGLGFVCKMSQTSFNGEYALKDYQMALTESDDSKLSVTPGLKLLDGTFTFGSRKFILRGGKRYIAGKADLINMVNNTNEGYVYLVWNPSPARVLNMIDSESYETDNVRAFIYLNDNTFPNGITKELRRGK